MNCAKHIPDGTGEGVTGFNNLQTCANYMDAIYE